MVARRTRKRSNYEELEQKGLFGWINSNCPKELVQFIFAVPNGGERPHVEYTNKQGEKKKWCPEGKRLKDMGVRAGVADIICLIPCDGFHGFVIEMKEPGKKPTPAQRSFLLGASPLGFKCMVAYSYMEARKFILDYFGIERLGDLNGRIRSGIPTPP